MNSRNFLPLTLAASLVIAPVAAIGGSRSASASTPEDGATAYSEAVIRLCAKIAATGANVSDEACDQAPSTHTAEDVERLCNKIDVFDLDITDPACEDDTAGAYVQHGAGGGLGATSVLLPAAGAAGIAGGIAASGSGNPNNSGGAN